MSATRIQLLVILLLFLFGAAGGFGAALYANPQTIQEPSEAEPFVIENVLFFPEELLFNSVLARSRWSASVRGQVIALDENSFTLGEIVFDENSKFKLEANGETLNVHYVPSKTLFVQFPVLSASENIQGKLLEKKELGFSDIMVGDILFGNIDLEEGDQGAWQAVGKTFSINNHLKP
ncbi:MAG: hypothetical protein U1C72_01200 [Candidatus Pacearchaeota archaeon]|nr:hypothetical protein [Candidatus Pacearchaeota archaeon]